MNVVILAAGMGKRMQSDLPKVLHPLAGKPLLSHVISTARQLNPSRVCVVYGHGGDMVPSRLAAEDLRFVLQAPQLGTGHAVMQATDVLNDDVPTLVLYGDVPLTAAQTLQALVDKAGREKLAVLTVDLEDPTATEGLCAQRIVSCVSSSRKMPARANSRSKKLIPAFWLRRHVH